MQRTKTIDVVTVTSSTGYVEPCNKISTIVDTIFKENFVRIANVNSPLFEEDSIVFKQFILNIFGKLHIGKELIAQVIALLDKVVSTTTFILKQQNANRLIIGLVIGVYKANKLTKFFDKIFDLSNKELENIECEVGSLLDKTYKIEKSLIEEYIKEIF